MIANPHPPHEAPIGLVPYILRLLLFATLVFGLVGVPSVATASSTTGFYVEATGHVLAGPFLEYWLENDGEQALGLPISDLVQHNGREAQYFQYGILVQKQNGSPSRLRSGIDLLNTLRSDPAMIGDRRVPSPRTVQNVSVDSRTQGPHSTGIIPVPIVDSALESYWQKWGGRESMGVPVTPAYDKGTTRTQWFEFGRIDLRNNGVSRAQIGLELALETGIPLEPVDRGRLPLFEPSRFESFAGDGTIPVASTPFDPVRLRIPSIDVDAAIEITSVDDGVMTNPTDPWNAGWYASFSRPGDWTNTVIAGHRDWWGYGPVVFWNLAQVIPGDTIYLLAADGSGATYIVESTELVPRTIDPQTIINDIGYEALTLITCGGSWTGTEYTDRVIVRARRI